jgi:hypothetical protein
VSDGAGFRTAASSWRDARCWRASLARFAARGTPRLFLPLLLAAGATPALAQPAPRPWLDWRTAETEHFVLHYPVQYREWTLALAQRIEGIRDQVTQVVGYSPTRRVHIVVDDPTNDANGYAFPALDAPTIVLWPTPPDPRSEIGNARVWEELLATHEFTHIAHLTRPSRNRWKRLLWSLSPVPLGPITTKAPRWVLEGYATYVEGKVTGSGRPNNAWRAAIIRQFALEGKLPDYATLSATGGWETGSFAYLVGSAYLEWLARRGGDSSIVALWRRSTAVTDRSFDDAFRGVYGDAPSDLYGRFVADVTTNAVALDRALEHAGLANGTMVQRLIRTPGDPAVSPDGRHVAITIRRVDAPSQLVVWKTTEEPDTTAERRRARQLARDPQDVPDRQFYPPPKKPVITLVAQDGAPFEQPRWFGDARRLLVVRRTPLADGTLRGDLYVWNAENGDLRQVTHGAGVQEADPARDGTWAAATRCAHGWCDLVRVDLATGEIRLLRPGSVLTNYYRPRISHRSGDIVVGEQSGDRWRIALVSSTSGERRYADPDDGVTRYDATFGPDGRTIVATTEAGGVPNLERIAPDGAVTRLTSTTGAAVGADVAPDGAIWFLDLHGKGYDLRRLSDSAPPAPQFPLASVLVDPSSPVLPPRISRDETDSARRPAVAPAPAEHRYALGPSRLRYFPATTSGPGGSAVQLGLLRTDPVGRYGVLLFGSAGSPALPQGGRVELTSHASRTEVTASGWASHEAPSRELGAALAEGLDLSRIGGALRLERTHVGDGWDAGAALAALGESQRASSRAGTARTAALAVLRGSARQRDDVTRFQETLALLGEAGRTDRGSYLRHRGMFVFGTGAGAQPLTTLRVSFGNVSGRGAQLERFALGGIASPLTDSLYDARRIPLPAYPLGSMAGTSFTAYRVTAPVAAVDLFYSSATTDLFRHQLRSFGAELRQAVPSIAALGTPALEVSTGFARAVDAPVKGRWQYFMTLRVAP